MAPDGSMRPHKQLANSRRCFHGGDRVLKHTLPVLIVASFALLDSGAPQTLSPAQQSHEQALFRRVFGEKVVTFDFAAVAKVKSLPPGERLKLDTNGDGKIDTIYFIDTDPKHEPQFRPILVKVIDQDGDMDRDGDGDLDSDLYVADWHADGTVDAVVEYKDTNHDNGVDEMGIYTYSAKNAKLGTDAIQVWWSRDVAGIHQLWDTINYRYQQPECQFRTAFGGSEIFASYIFDSQNGKWVPSWENPFAFYDEDGDNLAEVAIRFSGSADRMESMRYSFDADNDTDGDNVHDYDFSFSCLSRANHLIAVPRALMETVRLRGGPVDPLLSWRNARRFGESADWGKVQLTWVENDNNVDSRPDGDPHERWEGVIASGTDQFPQVGGPPVGPYNSRYEADLDNSGKMKLYYLSEDRRIHLFGADTGSLKADYNYDGKVDMEFRYRDSDHDGVIDTWEIDIDGDGLPDRTVHVTHPHLRQVPLTYKPLTTFYNRSLDQALYDNQVLIDELRDVLKNVETSFKPDEIESYYTNELANYRLEAGVGRKIRNSRAGTRYYQDLIRERYFFRVTKALRSRTDLLRRLNAVYDAGDFVQTARLLSTEFPRQRAKNIYWPSDLNRRVRVHVSNPESSARLNEPVVLDVSSIRKEAADFNPRNFTVMSGARWIAARELPSQADDLDGDGTADQIVFLADLRANEESDYWVYYSATGERHNSYASGTAAAPGWFSDANGFRWESKKVTYGFTSGRIEFLENGVKALDSGDTAGLGGLTIWQAGSRYPVFAAPGLPAIRFHHQILCAGPVRTIVQVDFDGFKTDQNRCDIRERFTIYANGPYSENSISFRSAKSSLPIRFSVGFARAEHDQYFFDAVNGYFGSWGRQNDTVQEVGQAAIFQEGSASIQQNTKQRDVVFALRPGEKSTYYLVGDWRLGRMFPVAPNVSNWHSETRTLAARLHTPLHARIGNVQSR
jgi:uncharacterized protein DUF4861